MADMITNTIAHLKTDPLWRDVQPLADLSEFDLKRSGVRTPALFVFLVVDTPKPDVRGTGAYLQSVEATVAVVIVDGNHNGQPLDFEPLRRTLRKQLFGWSPMAGHEPYWLGRGKLLGVGKGQASWIDHFSTEYTADQLAP
uniref:phage tail terminator protein n=1 Tax=Thaumasiovibrio occultus TaxID=1891184 RepID=UPI000B34D2DF|nr:hypothetical protein [Thaumasiovibrio occultus]